MERNPNLRDDPRYLETSTEARNATMAVAEPSDGRTPVRTSGPFRSLRRLLVAGKRSSGQAGDLMEALEADSLLLREENAGLREKLEASPSIGHVIERLRALPGGAPGSDSCDDDHWQKLLDLIVMRNSLIDVCREITSVMAGLEDRLTALDVEGQQRNGHLKEARAQ
jgi:hypothetical protein